MLVNRKKPNDAVTRVADVVQDTGSTDYILDGKIYKNAPVKSVIVTSESDLADLIGYEVGTIAYTAGFASMWQLSAGGQWVEV